MFNVIIGDETFSLSDKTPIKNLIKKENEKDYFAAKVNNRLRELTYELCFDSNVELLDATHYDAIKVYETSLRYLLAMAFNNLYPELTIRISYNISRSLMVSVIEPYKVIVDSKMVKNIKAELDRLVSLDIPFDRKTISKEEARKYYQEHNQNDKEAILNYRPERNCHVYVCGDYENYMFGYMVPSTGYIKDYNLFAYDGHLVVQYPRYEHGGKIPEFKDEPTFSKVLKKSHKWAKICNAELVSKINDHITNETDVDFINMCETQHNDMLSNLGESILKDIENIRLICIAGPSSSGKTTFSNRLRIELMSKGIQPLRISLDMYYKKREFCPKDEDGNYDFESIYALDLELLNEQILALINGEEVALPKFDFTTNEITFGKKIKIDEKTPIIIEGIHALNDQLSYAIPRHQKFKIFIAPQFQINIDNHNPISFTDIRLLRRIVRDRATRSTSAEKTLSMWRSVRRGEFKWIYPYQEGCDFVYNSALTYELCVMRKYALPALMEIKPDSPHYITANRLIKFLKYFKEMESTWIPCNSLLREFIGGSCFKDV